jgi:ubiquinone/menaquinone biosynthesis C-methylase UbiE
VVCDIGAGTGRFTLPAARRARRVIAIDAVPALLTLLRRTVRAQGVANVTVKRGSFAALPLRDASVDVAVACSAFASRGPHGGVHAVAEAERIVRPGGDVVVIWPAQPAWLQRRGFTYMAVQGGTSVRFADVATAERLCARYYSRVAAEWVRRQQTPDVPYAVLGLHPPSDVCVKRIE